MLTSAPVRGPRGFTLIEVLIGIAIISILMTAALPAFKTFLQNTQLKNAAETTLAGINLARAEAVRRNSSVRFQLVSTLTSGCALSAAALNWVVSQDDVTSAAGKCSVAPSDTTAPRIVQKKSAGEGTANVTVATTGGSTIVFTSLGRVSGAGITKFDFSNAVGGTCEHLDSATGTMRCLRILVSTGGSVKLCDPKVTDATDPRICS